MSSPTISVVMPCFNGERYIRNAVAGVFGQTYQDFELIVVDDGSTDKSQETLREIKDSRLIVIRQENRGLAAARNAGLARVQGQYVAFLDVDDSWHCSFLERLLRALEEAPKAAVAYCGWQNIGLSGGRGKPYIPPDYEGERKLEHLLAECPWPVHAALSRYEMVGAAGGFDEELPVCEDYDLWLRIAAFNPILLVPEVLAIYNFHGGEQLSKNRARIARYQWLVKRRFVKEHSEIVRKLGRARVHELTTGGLLRRGYDCYWHRELAWAQEIFRVVFWTGHWQARDLRYLLPALMPFPLYERLVGWIDRRNSN